MANLIATGIGPVTDRFLNESINKLNNPQFRIILANRIIDPVTGLIVTKIKPYLYYVLFLYIVVVLLLLIIIYLIYHKNR